MQKYTAIKVNNAKSKVYKNIKISYFTFFQNKNQHYLKMNTYKNHLINTYNY